jgi:hypothetical protein
MQRDDHELEKYLRKFKPRDPRPLDVRPPLANAWIGRLAAAAIIAISVGGWFWYARYEARGPALQNVETQQREVLEVRQNPTAISLTKLALEDDKQFQAELEAQSRRVLPDFRGQQSTLNIFAKE